MAQPLAQDLRLGPSPLDRIGRMAFRFLVATWIVSFAVVLVALFGSPYRGRHSVHAFFLILSSVLAAANIARQLPLQNVIATACIIGGAGGVAHSVNGVTGIPFGPCVYTLDIGRLVFGFLPWPMPFLWVMLAVASRGTARLILRPLRSHPGYGYFLLTLATFLVVLLDVALEVFCSRVMNYWQWLPTRVALGWYGVPLMNFLGWGISSFFIIAFVTPFLLNKSPRPEPGPDLVPLLLWAGTSLLLSTGIWRSGFTAAGILQVVLTFLVVSVALWGGLRRHLSQS